MIILIFQVYKASTELSDWKMMVSNLRSEYEQLLFFSIPKLLHLYQNLLGGHHNIASIVNDVSILFQNKHEVQRKLKHTVKVSYGRWLSSLHVYDRSIAHKELLQKLCMHVL